MLFLLYFRGYFSPPTSTYVSTIIFSTLLWLAIIYLLRYMLKILLSYRKFMYEPRGKMSVLTKLWTVSRINMWKQNETELAFILFSRYNQAKPIISFVSFCLFNPLTVCIFGTNCPISVGFPPLYKSLNNTLNKKCQKTKIIFYYFRLILLDRITYRVNLSYFFIILLWLAIL